MIWLVAAGVVVLVLVVFVLGLCKAAACAERRRSPDDEVEGLVDEAGRRIVEFTRRRLG